MPHHHPFEGSAFWCSRPGCMAPKSADVHQALNRYDSAPSREDRDIEARFREFHEANPQVYRELVKRARQIKERGFERYSMKTLMEVTRWHAHLTTTGEPFKLNNSYTAHYARLIMEQEDDLRDFFETRERGAA